MFETTTSKVIGGIIALAVLGGIGFAIYYFGVEKKPMPKLVERPQKPAAKGVTGKSDVHASLSDQVWPDDGPLPTPSSAAPPMEATSEWMEETRRTKAKKKSSSATTTSTSSMMSRQKLHDIEKSQEQVFQEYTEGLRLQIPMTLGNGKEMFDTVCLRLKSRLGIGDGPNSEINNPMIQPVAKQVEGNLLIPELTEFLDFCTKQVQSTGRTIIQDLLGLDWQRASDKEKADASEVLQQCLFRPFQTPDICGRGSWFIPEDGGKRKVNFAFRVGNEVV